MNNIKNVGLASRKSSSIVSNITGAEAFAPACMLIVRLNHADDRFFNTIKEEKLNKQCNLNGQIFISTVIPKRLKSLFQVARFKRLSFYWRYNIIEL